MKVAISGASGLVGRALGDSLRRDGHRVLRLVRRPSASPDAIYWQPTGDDIDRDRLEGLDAVVHLAGESIAGGRWTAERKRRIKDSRVYGTRLLANTLAGLERRPRVLVSASAVGYYGDRGDELLDEEAPPGDLFLSTVCQAWEAVADPARDAGIRVVHPRLGMVLAREGGALDKMLLPFRLGLGGRIGDGRQWVSWITRDDLVGVLRHLIDGELAGPVNAVSPHPVRFADFASGLGRVLHRPAILPLPAPVARLALGEMADELLLPSLRADASRLVASGFGFRHPHLEPALRELLA